MGASEGDNGATPRSPDPVPAATVLTPHQLEDVVSERALEGTEIGRYRVRHVVGAGGMGLVLAAHDDELGRSVAIKLVARDQEEARTRLLREAQAMARLSHPNVVTVFEVLRVGDRAAIVMELVEGEDLASWQRNAARGWRAIVAAYSQAARGLAAAHRAGLVHRDFKPSNALIDHDGVVRVTDFGLVRNSAAEHEPSSDGVGGDRLDTALTRTGAVMGTPAFMAPEQHRGEPVDARTDQWALACALYGALFDQHPFGGTTRDELSTAVAAGVVRAEPKHVRVPRRIRAAIRRALSRDPDDRFPTMDALIAALAPRTRAWLFAGVGAGLAIAAVVAVVALRPDDAVTCDGLEAPFDAAWNAGRARALRDRFSIADVNHGAAAATRVGASLDRYRSGWVAMRTRACTDARQGVGSDDLLDRRMRCLDRRLVEVDTLVAGLLEADTRVARRANGAVGQLYPVEDCEDPVDTVPRPADPQVRAAIAQGEADVSRAWAEAELGRFDRARPLAESAAAVGEQTGWHPLTARALLQLARSLNRNREGVAALASIDRAAAAAAEARDDTLLAEALVSRFFTLAAVIGRSAEALADRQFVELAVARAGDSKRVRAGWLHHLAAAYYYEHRYQEALDAEMQSAAILREFMEPDNVALRDSKGNEAVFRTALGQLDKAAVLLDEVLAAKIAELGPEHPELVSTLVNLGELEMRSNKQLAAIEHWEQAVALQRNAGVKGWIAPFDLGMGRIDLGRWSAAIDALTEAVTNAEAMAVGDSTNVGYTATNLGGLLTMLGDLERARPLLDRGLAAARGADSSGINDTLGHLALYALARGDLADARKLVAEARAAKDPAASALLAEAELAQTTKDCKAAAAAFDRAIEVAKEQPEEWVITRTTVGRAECQFQSGAARDAVAALETRLAWLEKFDPEPGAAASLRFALARGLVATGGDRDRARTLAAAARDGFATLGAPGTKRATSVTRWLASH